MRTLAPQRPLILLVAVLALSTSAWLALAVAPSTASVSYNCKGGPLAPGYNTIVCGRSKKEAERYCSEAGVEHPPTVAGVLHLKAHYLKGSTSKLSISFETVDIHGCDPVGTRKISVFQELRKGPAGQFQRNGGAVTIETNNQTTVDKTVNAPYICAAGMAGSAIKTVVELTWIPRKGWGNKQAHSIGQSPVQAIC
jgi:hypothetical protein